MNEKFPDIRMPSMINLDTSGLRRYLGSLAQDEIPKRMILFTIFCLVTNVVATSASVIKNTSSYENRPITYTEEANRNFDGTSNFIHPYLPL